MLRRLEGTDLTLSESETVSYGRGCKSAFVDRAQLVTLPAMEALFFNVRVLHALNAYLMHIFTFTGRYRVS